MENENRFTLVEGYQDPNADSRMYSKNWQDINRYIFQTEAYEGTGGFDSGSYLIAHQREAWFQNRMKFSVYVNFVRPIIKAMVEPVFVKEPTRGYRTSPLTESFIQDSTLSGINMTEFTEKCLTYLRLHSVVFVVVDNVNAGSSEMLEVEAAQSGMRPYAYLRTADKTCPEWIKTTEFGQLESIIFKEKPVLVKTGQETKWEERFRMWSATDSKVLRKKENAQGKDDFEVIETIEHGLGMVPVAVIHDTKPSDPEQVLVCPKMRGVVRLAHSIYNKDSEIRELERSQSFAIFCIQQNTGKDGAAGLVLGPNNVLFYPEGASNPPAYISPDMNVLKQLLENRESQKKDLFDLAEQSGVMAVTKEAKSGLALSYEFRAYEETLKKSAQLAEEIEMSIMAIFEGWTGLATNYEVNYDKDFKPQRGLMDVEIIERLSMVDSIADVTREEIAVMSHLIIDPEADQETLDAIREELRAKEDQESRVEPQQDIND